VKQVLRLLQEAVSYLAGDLDHAFFLRSLDHGANVQLGPDLQAGSSNPFGQLDLFPERSQNTVGVSAPAVRQDEQGSQAGCTSAHEARSRASAKWRSRDSWTTPASHSRVETIIAQSHPRNHFASFHSDFIGLHMHQIQLPLLDEPLMYASTMRSCSITPIGDGSLIQAQGMHDRLDWTPIGKPRHNDHDQFLWFAQPFKHRSPTTTERFLADATAIALPLAIMDANIALSSLASCRTRLIGAKCFRRVH
jgi:hypothetical protein